MTTIITVCTTPAASLEALGELCSWAHELRLAYAWAASEDGEAAHWQALPLEKVTRATIGVKFASTEPTVLQQLFTCGRDVLRVVADTVGVFHPKVIVGIRQNEAQALLGSSNFTSGGFNSNTELNVHLSGSLDESPLIDIVAFVDAQWLSRMARRPTSDWLERYAEAYHARPPPHAVPPLPAPKPPPPPPVRRPAPPRPPLLNDASQLLVQWVDFFRMIQSREGHRLANGHPIYVFGEHANGSYLREVEQCQRLFQRHGSLAAMPEDDRKFVAGFGGSSGYFGSMRGAGNFKNLVIASPGRLSNALDEVPSEGTVSEGHVRSFLYQALSIYGVNLGTATRLLVTKRPDYFISLNNASRARIKTIFKAAPTGPEPYLKLLARIWTCPWFRSAPPSDPQQLRVWNARVGLLDALMYEAQ